jgi:uncharacterized iron-regulated membrane protein
MAKISNRFWFQLHGWFSLPIWIIFCFVCLTGTISVVSHELTWLTNSSARANNPLNLEAKSAAELVSIVQEAYPTAKVSTALTFEPYLVNAVAFADSDKPFALAYINQYTGEIQEINEGMTFVNFMGSLHGWLLFPWQHNYSVGYYVVSAMAIVMLGALITGLVIYKNFWRSFTQPKLRFKQGKKTLLADLHRLAGVWSIWFLLLMSLTGLWYLTQSILWHNDVEIEAHPLIVAIENLPSNVIEVPITPITFVDALKVAKEKFPDFKGTYLMMPEHNRDTYKLYGEGDFIFYDKYAYGVIIDSWTGEVVGERTPENMTLLQTLTHIADPLHYGTIGGILTKFIWFVFGTIVTGMSITGFLMWGSRTVKAARSSNIPVDGVMVNDLTANNDPIEKEKKSVLTHQDINQQGIK